MGRNYHHADLTALEKSILARIERVRLRTLRLKFSFITIISLASLAGIIREAVSLGRTGIESGFYDYASLFFSDGAVVATHWKELAFSLLESVPLISITLLLCACGLFLWSGARVMRDARSVMLPV